MATPVIKISSVSGSDSLASGAGPSTALTGTNASTDGGGTTVTLDGSPNLSGVATDGSHTIFLNDTTAGHRNHSAITAVDNVLKTVTVSPAFTGSLSGKSWAIGGVRASLFAVSSSQRLIDNNSAVGDALAGWVLELQDGHSETIAAGAGPAGDGRMIFRRTGDVTSGPITVRGVAGFTTRPLLINANNVNCFTMSGAYYVFQDFELQNSNATKTLSSGVQAFTATNVVIQNLKIDHATNKFWKGFLIFEKFTVRDCTIGNTVSHGISCDLGDLKILNCYIHDTGGAGVFFTDVTSALVWGCLIVHATGAGIDVSAGGSSVNRGYSFIANTIYTCGDGIKVELASTNLTLAQILIANNLLVKSGGYGLTFTGAGITAAVLGYLQVQILFNDFALNTSGSTSPASIGEGQSDVDPNFDGLTSNYAIPSTLAGLGYPLAAVGTTSLTRSYVDPGAAQRQGGGLLISGGMVGGMRG